MNRSQEKRHRTKYVLGFAATELVKHSLDFVNVRVRQRQSVQPHARLVKNTVPKLAGSLYYTLFVLIYCTPAVR